MQDRYRGFVSVRMEDEDVAGVTERLVPVFFSGASGDDACTASRRIDATFVHHHDHVGAFDVRRHASADDGVGWRPDPHHHHETQAGDERDDDGTGQQSAKTESGTEHDPEKRRIWALLSTTCLASSHAFPVAIVSILQINTNQSVRSG